MTISETIKFVGKTDLYLFRLYDNDSALLSLLVAMETLHAAYMHAALVCICVYAFM